MSEATPEGDVMGADPLDMVEAPTASADPLHLVEVPTASADTSAARHGQVSLANIYIKLSANKSLKDIYDMQQPSTAVAGHTLKEYKDKDDERNDKKGKCKQGKKKAKANREA